METALQDIMFIIILCLIQIQIYNNMGMSNSKKAPNILLGLNAPRTADLNLA